jgi:uncharacterized phage protein (TIGR02218 family)
MRTVSSAFKSHLAQETTSLCGCWRIVRTDGVTFGFTDNSSDIVIDGLTYVSSTGMRPSTVASSVSLTVDNLEIMSAFDSQGVTERDMRAGLFDHAEVLFFLVNYESLGMGKMIVKRGWIGQVQSKQGAFYSEFRSLAQAALSEIVELSRQTCRCKRLGDERCQVNLDGYTLTGYPIRSLAVIASVVKKRIMTVNYDDSIQYPQSFFRRGVVLFQNGENAGIECEIKDSSGSTLTLQQPAPFSFAIGDIVRLEAGCDRRIETCGDVFGNNGNFRGEPYVPGSQKLAETIQV